MLKTYQFKTQCKGNIHSSKTANIILQDSWQNRWTPLHVQNGIQVQMHPWMLVETTRVTEFEYYFTCTPKAVYLSCIFSHESWQTWLIASADAYRLMHLYFTTLTYLLRLSSSHVAWHIGQQRVVSSVTGRQQQLHLPPMWCPHELDPCRIFSTSPLVVLFLSSLLTVSMS